MVPSLKIGNTIVKVHNLYGRREVGFKGIIMLF